MTRTARKAAPAGYALVALDAALVVLFAWLGRRSHDESLDALGVAQTAWPFVVALLLGWLLVRANTGAPAITLGSGVTVWICTVALGMGLRVLSGDTAATPFVVVATLTLGVFLLGWRLLVRLVTARRR